MQKRSKPLMLLLTQYKPLYSVIKHMAFFIFSVAQYSVKAFWGYKREYFILVAARVDYTDNFYKNYFRYAMRTQIYVGCTWWGMMLKFEHKIYRTAWHATATVDELHIWANKWLWNALLWCFYIHYKPYTLIYDLKTR